MSSIFIDRFVAPELAELERRSLARRIPEVDYGPDRMLLASGRRCLNLASNNYLGLAGHPALKEGAAAALQRYGTSSGASRLVTGNFSLYDLLESELALFKGQQAALVVGSGFAANLSIFSALADRSTVVFSDRLNHASIIDGIALSGARQVRYRHNDTDHARALLEKHRDAPRKILVTDTVFSMDGDAADLPALVRLCRDFEALLVVDEAHATGIFGCGRGMAAEQGVGAEVDVHMGTFSKGLGSHGGYIAGRRKVIDLIVSRGRAFVFSTALPPAVIGANLAALRMIGSDPGPAVRLLHMSADLRTHLTSLGLDTGPSVTQILPVVLGGNPETLAARDFLLERGVFVAAVRPPTVPEGTARLRISLRADLTDADLAAVKDAFADLARGLRARELRS
jgi:8-amino-7-oxononanoate synthase